MSLQTVANEEKNCLTINVYVGEKKYGGICRKFVPKRFDLYLCPYASCAKEMC